jgi:hypothetical protein
VAEVGKAVGSGDKLRYSISACSSRLICSRDCVIVAREHDDHPDRPKRGILNKGVGFGRHDLEA